MTDELDPHAPLRDDVRRLGAILGDVLVGHGSQALYDDVEAIRQATKAARADDTSLADVVARVEAMPVERARDVARAFAHFLTLANIAEQHHRIRRRRFYQMDAARPPQRGSCEEVFQRLREEGMGDDELFDAVCQLDVELVLTAHPTEVARRTILQKHLRVSEALSRNDRPDLTVSERRDIEHDLRREIASMWETDELRRSKPTPLEEARAGLVVFEQSLWDAVPAWLRGVDDALRDHTGRALPMATCPVRFGSWMGGDRDGNPNVTAQVTLRAVELTRWMAATLYLDEVKALRDELSMHAGTPSFVARAGGAREPYRVILGRLRDRLRDTEVEARARIDQRPPPGGLRPLRSATDLMEPLVACHQSLEETGCVEIANGRLLDLIRRVACFGLTLVKVDIRQDAGRHAEALDEVTRYLGLGSYLEWSEDERVAFLTRELEGRRPLVPRDMPATPRTAEVLDTFRAIASIGSESLGAYVISMASHPSDVLAVLLLQRDAGIARPLRVVPLFETEADLRGAPEALERLFACDPYRATLDGRQEVMIGYSDSAKDAGRLAASWVLFRGQQEIAETCRRHEIDLTLFHGRGGTVGRGGGPTYLAILSQPPGSVGGSLRVTEQGEMIQAKFGMTGIAHRTLEIYTTATLEATLADPAPPPQAWTDMAEELAVRSAAAYRAIVREHPRFVEYFRAATPERELGALNIGSRPARRRGGDGVASLRAIPWVFAWTQTRLLLPSWLGVGDAIGAMLDEGHVETLRAMYRDWRWFRSTINLIQMVLAKAEPGIAAHYDRVLVPDDLRELGDELRQRLAATRSAVLRVVDTDELLSDNAVLKRSIGVRNPYVDPINLVQAELLRRHRQAPEDAALLDALMVTVNGVAAGMRNTG